MKFVGVPSSTAKAAATALAPGLKEEEHYQYSILCDIWTEVQIKLFTVT
jgi:hypothetical protein